MRAYVLVLAALLGCRPHVQLALPPNPTPDQRVEAFNALHAKSELTTWTTSCQRPGGCSTTVERTLSLANGTKVYHPEDLLPVLPADSAAAQSVHASLRARRSQRNFTLLTIGAFAALVVIGSQTLGNADGVSLPGKLALLACGGGVLVGAFGTWHYYYKAAAYHGDANEQYNEGLGRQLDVCADGLRVVPCESGALTPPVSNPPAQPWPGVRP